MTSQLYHSKCAPKGLQVNTAWRCLDIHVEYTLLTAGGRWLSADDEEDGGGGVSGVTCL